MIRFEFFFIHEDLKFLGASNIHDLKPRLYPAAGEPIKPFTPL